VRTSANYGEKEYYNLQNAFQHSKRAVAVAAVCLCTEHFSNDYPKTKTKVIIPANHNKHKLPNEPNESELEANTCSRRQAREKACEQVLVWFEFYF